MNRCTISCTYACGGVIPISHPDRGRGIDSTPVSLSVVCSGKEAPNYLCYCHDPFTPPIHSHLPSIHTSHPFTPTWGRCSCHHMSNQMCRQRTLTMPAWTVQSCGVECRMRVCRIRPVLPLGRQNVWAAVSRHPVLLQPSSITAKAMLCHAIPQVCMVLTHSMNHTSSG